MITLLSTSVGGGGDVSGAFGFTDFLTVALWLVISLVLLFVSAAVLITLITVITSLITRATGICKLRTTAKKAGFTYRQNRCVLLSFFKTYSGCDFVLEDGNKRIAVKLFPYFVKGKSLIISDNVLSVSGKFVAVQVRHIMRAPGRDKTGDIFPFNLSLGKRKIDLTFNCEADERIILMCPVPYSAKYVSGNSLVTVDNGVEYTDGSLFYDLSSLIHRLENNAS